MQRAQTPLNPTISPNFAQMFLWLALLSLAACGNTQVQGEIVGADGDGTIDGKNNLDSKNVKDTVAPLPDIVSATADVPPLSGTFGAECKINGDCDSGHCIDSYAGKICTKICTESCPTGFLCAQVASPDGSDNPFICIPRFKNLCNPCDLNADCNGVGEKGNVCISFGASGSFCGAKCDEINPDCPSDSVCEVVVDSLTGLKSHQCKHKSALGLCGCSAAAAEAGLHTKCSNTNDYGTCTGQRLCTSEGLTECQADVPAAEICDNKDNDCNGATDDFNAKSFCDLKNEFGSCKGVIKACVDGVSKCEGTMPAPEACNGLDDNCNGETDEGLCEDGDPCTKGTCNTDGSCKQTQINGLPCDDGSVCSTIDKCLSGKCVGGGALPCDDKDPCTADACDPFTGCTHVSSSDAVCTDDGNACTNDVCQDGKCQHLQKNDGSPCADDGIACTADICQGGNCNHPPAEGLKCDDDGNQCTDDVCQAGKCKHVNGSAPCEDGDTCTENDTCSAGKCLKGPIKNCNDGNPCTTDSCKSNIAGGCVHDASSASGASCASTGSSECPVGVCSGGACFAKANVTCETKIKSDLCQSDPVAGVCTAAGKCVVTKAPPQYTCPGCNGICLKCFLQLCIPF